MEPIHGRRCESKSPSESEVDDAVGETRKRRYTGLSRTTRWRQRKRRQAANNDEDSTSESDTVLQQEFNDAKPEVTSMPLSSRATLWKREAGLKSDEESSSVSNSGQLYAQHQEHPTSLATTETDNDAQNGSDSDSSSLSRIDKPTAQIKKAVEAYHIEDDQHIDVAANHGNLLNAEVMELERVLEDSPDLNHTSHSIDLHSHTLPDFSNFKNAQPDLNDDSKTEVDDTSSQTSCSEDSNEDHTNTSDHTSLPSGSGYCPSSDEWKDVSTDEFSSDLECFVAHYLEEQPRHHQPDAQPEDPHDIFDHDHGDDDDPDHDPMDAGHDDPDDPDDPGYEEQESSSSSEDSADDNAQEVATVHNNRLNRNVRLVQNLTVGEIIVLELALAVRHKKTFESIIDHFKNLNLPFGPSCFPESKTKLWDIIFLNKAGIQFHVYCGNRRCGSYIKRRDRIRNNIVRCRCGYSVPLKKAKFFISLDLKSQLMYFLSVPGIWEKLQYPQTRRKISPTAIEDVLDGAHYQRLKQPGGPLENPNNFSFFFNFDACNATKKGSIKLVPLFIRINELPPELRQKFHFPAAIFVDTVEPNPQAYLKPFVQQARRLSTQGINWKPDGVNEINSKFIPAGFNVDSPVRYGMLNMSKWDCRAYGCTYCTHRGVREAGSQRYPELHLENIPPFEDRSHEGMIAAMLQVQRDNNIEVLQGHKGTSVLMLLQHLDLRDGQAQDDLHQDHEGCAADLTELILTTEDARVVRNMDYAALVRAINARLLQIKTPSRISRKPRSIDKRSNYNGSEWRNWLFFYAVPCLLGLIKAEYLDILAALSHACYLLSQDSIEPDEVNTAERLLLRVATSFERTFGVGRMKYNLHVTTKHKVRSVRNLGNPWSYSTYNFESLNRKMISRVTSPKGAILQILTRVLLHMTVYAAQYDQRLPEEVRLRIEEILNPYKLKSVRQVGAHTYLVGRGIARATNGREAEVLAREGINIRNIVEYKSFLVGSTRYRSVPGQNQTIKSDDTFIYSSQNTFCTIKTVCSFMDDNGEERCGLFVTEHDVVRAVPVARHISVLHNENADLHHFISLQQVRCPALKINIGNIVYAVCVPNCFEID